MDRWLANPVETLLVLLLGLAGLAWAPALAGAALLFAALEIRAGLRKRPEPRWVPDLWPGHPAELTVLYDATCVLCVRSKGALEAWPTAAAFRFVPIQAEEAGRLVPGLPPQQLGGAMHVVEGGVVWSAERGWSRLARNGPWPLALLSVLVPAFAAGLLYRWIARNRHRWFGTLPLTSCDSSGSCASGSRGPS